MKKSLTVLLKYLAKKSFLTKLNAIATYRVFTVNSAGSINQRFDLLEHEIENVWNSLGLFSAEPTVIDIDTIIGSEETIVLWDSTFKKYGSDKSTYHNYHRYYSTWHERLQNGMMSSILEIGLGTNNSQILSNMGIGGKPLASLHAWKNLGFSSVAGADIDRDLLNDESFDLFFCDQLNSLEFATIMKKRNKFYDVIVDDGLHTINANLITLKSTWDYLNDGGVYLVEDVHKDSLPFWRYFLGTYFPNNSKIILTKGSNCLIEIVK